MGAEVGSGAGRAILAEPFRHRLEIAGPPPRRPAAAVDDERVGREIPSGRNCQLVVTTRRLPKASPVGYAAGTDARLAGRLDRNVFDSSPEDTRRDRVAWFVRCGPGRLGPRG